MAVYVDRHLAHHLCRMADNACEQINADRLVRAAEYIRADLARPKVSAERLAAELRQEGYLVPLSAVRRILAALEE